MTAGALMELPAHVVARPVRRGHAGQPGMGPKGETCRSCGQVERVQGGRKLFAKCKLMRKSWTRGSGSDVHLRDPACPRWEAPAAGDAA
jgi:hypothetical protein